LLKIICLSDTHELHRDVDVPDGDLLIHAGDITFFSRRPSVLTDFNDWLGELPHLYKVVIPVITIPYCRMRRTGGRSPMLTY
jgi:hypothetical protein